MRWWSSGAVKLGIHAAKVRVCAQPFQRLILEIPGGANAGLSTLVRPSQLATFGIRSRGIHLKAHVPSSGVSQADPLIPNHALSSCGTTDRQRTAL